MRTLWSGVPDMKYQELGTVGRAVGVTGYAKSRIDKELENTPGQVRTGNLRLRRPTRYPIVPRARDTVSVVACFDSLGNLPSSPILVRLDDLMVASESRVR